MSQLKQGFLQSQKCTGFRLPLLLMLIIGLLGGTPIAIGAQENYTLNIPLGLDEDSMVIPPDNPLTQDKVDLGQLLFFDKRLSKNNTIACGSCHMP